jgi:putative phosphoribosyl transferase
MRYEDRTQAGRLSGEALASYASRQCVVYALPRGGVPVAAEVARALSAPLDLILVRKIGVPFQPELAHGAVADGDVPETILNEDFAASLNADDDMIADAVKREMREIARRSDLYLSGQEPIRATGRVAFVVDDGLATGATAPRGSPGRSQTGPATLDPRHSRCAKEHGRGAESGGRRSRLPAGDREFPSRWRVLPRLPTNRRR